jgi:hypothetical protein
MKSLYAYLAKKLWIYLYPIMLVIITLSLFNTCQNGGSINDLNNTETTKFEKTSFYIESDLDESVDVPPPPWGKTFNSDGTELKGFNISITENTVLGISHIYRKNTGPYTDCMIILFIIEKGDMLLTWADPKYTNDDRLDHINLAIRNNCAIAISINEVILLDAENHASAESFWSQFHMTMTPPHPLAPEQEYFVKSTSGTNGTINLINGTLKVL